MSLRRLLFAPPEPIQILVWICHFEAGYRHRQLLVRRQSDLRFGLQSVSVDHRPALARGDQLDSGVCIFSVDLFILAVPRNRVFEELHGWHCAESPSAAD